MALIRYPELSEVSQKAREILAGSPQNIARMYAGSGEMFPGLIGFAASMFGSCAFTDLERELLTLRIAHRFDAAYVQDQHAVIATKAGASDAQLKAVKGSLPSQTFTDEVNAALLLIDALCDDIHAPADLILRTCSVLGEKKLIQIFLIWGFYTMASAFTNSLELELDAQEKGTGEDFVRENA